MVFGELGLPLPSLFESVKRDRVLSLRKNRPAIRKGERLAMRLQSNAAF
jgi:hypothetical protein